jgi:hypothetical protein
MHALDAEPTLVDKKTSTVQYSTHTLYTVGTVSILKEAWVTPGGNIWIKKLTKFMLLGHIGQNFFRSGEKYTNSDKDNFLLKNVCCYSQRLLL